MMNMKINILFLILIPFMGRGQEVFTPNLDDFSSSVIQMAKANAPVEYMSSDEEQVVFYMNLARMEPALFMREILKPYIVYYDIEVDRYVKSLYKELQNRGPVPALLCRKIYLKWLNPI